MKTLEDIKARCRIDDDGHWIWTGAMRDGSPIIWGPDFTADPTGNKMSVQRGRRAVWHLYTGKPIPDGQQVYQTCSRQGCVNHDCLACGTQEEQGRLSSLSGRVRTDGESNRDSKREVTGTMRALILADLAIGLPEPVIANKHDLPRKVIRESQMYRSMVIANPFAGLMR